MPNKRRTISFVGYRPGVSLRRKPDRKGEVRDPFYSSTRWRKLRTWFMAQPENALCARCLKAGGIQTPAVICDHIVPRQVCPERELDPDNLQALCRGCDNAKTAEDVRRGEVGAGTTTARLGPKDDPQTKHAADDAPGPVLRVLDSRPRPGGGDRKGADSP